MRLPARLKVNLTTVVRQTGYEVRMLPAGMSITRRQRPGGPFVTKNIIVKTYFSSSVSLFFLVVLLFFGGSVSGSLVFSPGVSLM